MSSFLLATINNLQTLIAASAEFQAAVGEGGNAAAAATHVYKAQADDDWARITAVTTGAAGAASLDVSGNVANLLSAGDPCRVVLSTANDGAYHVRAGGTYDAGTDTSTVNIVEAIGDNTVDGALWLQPMPRAIIGAMGSRRLEKTSTTGWSADGPLGMAFEFLVDAANLNPYNAGAAYDAFQGSIETIIDEMAALAGTNTYLDVIEFIETEPALPNRPDDMSGIRLWWTQWDLIING